MAQAGTVIAARTALMHYELLAPDGNAAATITLKNGIWPAQAAPATPFLPKAITNHPEITAGGQTYVAHRRLRTNKFLFNDFDIWLANAAGDPVISAITVGYSWTTAIKHAGQDFALRRKSSYRFAFDLTRDMASVATFHDTTPFWTMSARRRFALDLSQPVDDVLLAFSLFLATSIFFRA
jgi:hypothetical protein